MSLPLGDESLRCGCPAETGGEVLFRRLVDAHRLGTKRLLLERVQHTSEFATEVIFMLIYILLPMGCLSFYPGLLLGFLVTEGTTLPRMRGRLLLFLSHARHQFENAA